MANFTGTTTVEAPPQAVFAYLADVGNLPRYFARMISAEPGEGDQVHTTARMPDGSQVQGTAWFRVDEQAQRIEWGSEGPNDYHGHLQVRPASHPVGATPAGPARSEVEVHLHTTRVSRGNHEVQDGIRETLAAIAEQVPQQVGGPAEAAEQAAGKAANATHQAAATAHHAVRRTAATAAQVARSPLTVTGQLFADVADSARRPDAVLYWGGLAGAALLGALDWPVAVALGIAVAVARGRRPAS